MRSGVLLGRYIRERMPEIDTTVYCLAPRQRYVQFLSEKNCIHVHVKHQLNIHVLVLYINFTTCMYFMDLCFPCIEIHVHGGYYDLVVITPLLRLQTFHRSRDN